MTYVVLGLVATNIIAVLVAIAFKHQVAKEKLAKVLAQGEAATAKAKAIDEKQRLEAVITAAKEELRKAEVDLAACSTPDAVRHRLNSLFP